MNRFKIDLTDLSRKSISRAFCQYIYDYHCKEFWRLVEIEEWSVERALEIFLSRLFDEDSDCLFFEVLLEQIRDDVVHLLRHEFASDEYIEHWRIYPRWRERDDE